MQITEQTSITVATTVHAPVATVWKCWTLPEYITQWNHASDDWHCPYAENDLRVNGTFKSTMAAKDGSMSFDFEGVYTAVDEHKRIEYTLADGRKVKITFLAEGAKTTVTEEFDPENINSRELQKGGWQAILDNFKKITEQA